MTTNYHNAIATGATNAPATINTPLGALDAQLATQAAQIATLNTSGVGSVYAQINNGAGEADTSWVVDNISGTFLAGATVVFTVAGVVYSATVAANTSTTPLTVTGAPGVTIPDNTVISQVPAAVAGVVLRNVFNVKDPTYGAVGDDATDDYQAITDAITAANAVGGVVYFPNASYYIATRIDLLSDVTLYFEPGAEIRADNNLTTAGANPLMRFNGVDNVTCYNMTLRHEGTDQDYNTLFIIGGSSYLRFYNLSIPDSPGWHCNIRENSHHIWIDGYTVNESDVTTTRRDGLDLHSCHDIWINNAQIKTGDDCIAIKALDGDTYNINISNCVLESNSGYGIDIGLDNTQDIHDVNINNVIFVGQYRGLGIIRSGSTYNGAIYRINVSNFSAFNATALDRGIYIASDNAYNSRIRDVNFNNITIAGDIANAAIDIWRTQSHSIQFNNVRLIATEPGGYGIQALYNSRYIQFSNVSIIGPFSLGLYLDGVSAPTGTSYFVFRNVQLGERYTPKQFIHDDNGSQTALSNAIDENTGTDATVSYTTAEDYFYISHDAPFHGVKFDIGATPNAVASTMVIETSDGDGTWTAATVTTDGTDSGGASLAIDGIVRFTPALTWSREAAADAPDATTVGKYWIRISFNATLTASVTIAEVWVTNSPSTALRIASASNNTFDGCALWGCPTNLNATGSPTGTIYRNFGGEVATEATSTGTFSAATTATVTHGLLSTPVSITLANTGAGSEQLTAEVPGSTTFRVRSSSSTSTTFRWAARVSA